MKKKPWFTRKDDNEKVDVARMKKDKITAESLMKKGKEQ